MAYLYNPIKEHIGDDDKEIDTDLIHAYNNAIKQTQNTSKKECIVNWDSVYNNTDKIIKTNRVTFRENYMSRSYQSDNITKLPRIIDYPMRRYIPIEYSDEQSEQIFINNEYPLCYSTHPIISTLTDIFDEHMGLTHSVECSLLNRDSIKLIILNYNNGIQIHYSNINFNIIIKITNLEKNEHIQTFYNIEEFKLFNWQTMNDNNDALSEYAMTITNKNDDVMSDCDTVVANEINDIIFECNLPITNDNYVISEYDTFLTNEVHDTLFEYVTITTNEMDYMIDENDLITTNENSDIMFY